MNLTSLLVELLGDYTLFGKGEHYFSCPFCNHHNRKLAVNLTNRLWHCWHCGKKGHIIFLFKRLGASPKKMKEVRDILAEDGTDYYERKVDSESPLHLPDEFKPLWKPVNTYEYKNAISYIKKRGITGYDIIRYGMGYCDAGEYSGRIIVPSYDEDGALNYFIARSYFQDEIMKYKNPKVSKNIVMFEEQINWNLPVTLCEGVFDAIAVRRNAIPLLGKFLPKRVELRLIEHEVKTVYVLLDDDARTDALKLEQKLKSLGIDTHQVSITGGDPADLGFEKTWSYINEAKPTSFRDFLKNRLQTI